jgi:hypothetical protein
MWRDQLQQRLRRRPFQPFRVYLSDGRVLDIPYAGMTLLAQTYVNIGNPVTAGPHPICDRLVHVPLTLIQRIDDLSPFFSVISGSTPTP